jgi:hypothetical protein
MRLDHIAKERGGIRKQQPRTPSRAPLSHTFAFDDERLEPGHRARVCRGAAGQAATNDDDIARVLAANARKVRSACAGELGDPRRLAVTGGHQKNATPK